MPRRARSIIGGYVYHILNRANGRMQLFRKEADYAAFETVIEQAQKRVPLRIIGYCVMSNYWHFVDWPKTGEDDQVSEFFRWLTATHTQRWHAFHGTSGMGHLYQGRFKSFPVQSDEHLLTVLRYVERNPVRAGLVTRAEAWRWSSLWRRTAGNAEQRQLLSSCPAPLGSAWVGHVNEPLTEVELNALRRSVQKGRPFGGEEWSVRTAKRLELEHTFRSPGRPKKGTGVI